jgi:methionyl-tRNA formyltransferase
VSALRVIFLGNGPLAVDALAWLQESGLRAAGAELAGLVVHPAAARRGGEALIALAGLPAERVFDGSRLEDAGVQAAVAALDADLGLSVMFGHILRPAFLGAFRRGCYNLHPAYLPWNRGAHTNVWSIVDGTPAGATLHRIDPGVDTGPVVARREVPVRPVDTGASLYLRQQDAALDLLRSHWTALAAGTAGETPQDPAAGTRHFVKDLARTDDIDLDAPTTARAVLDQLRARTFAPHRGATFTAPDGRRVQVRVELEYVDEEVPV